MDSKAENSFVGGCMPMLLRREGVEVAERCRKTKGYAMGDYLTLNAYNLLNLPSLPHIK